MGPIMIELTPLHRDSMIDIMLIHNACILMFFLLTVRNDDGFSAQKQVPHSGQLIFTHPCKS